MEQKEHHRRELLFLLGFLIVFFIIFATTFLDIRRGTPVLGTGLPYIIEDLIILVLSVIAIFKVIWHILIY